MLKIKYWNINQLIKFLTINKSIEFLLFDKNLFRQVVWDEKEKAPDKFRGFPMKILFQDTEIKKKGIYLSQS
ncbi:MAG: hypothetical protein EA341_10700 [Mongoliibacter sp.]|nr:MAG: hypothetical protein EA341_10700 [Mongoliibacter sp.]